MVEGIEISDEVVEAALDRWWLGIFPRGSNSPYDRSRMREVILAAIAADRVSDARVIAEREACADIVESFLLKSDKIRCADTIDDCVEAIRARGKTQ